MVLWVDDIEEAYDISLPDEKVFDPETMEPRNDLTIASLARLVGVEVARREAEKAQRKREREERRREASKKL